MTEAYNMDCMEYMRSLPDGAFDLAVVDPPYGDGNGGKAQRFGAIYVENTRSHSVHVEREREPGHRVEPLRTAI